MRTIPIVAVFLLVILASLADNKCSTCRIKDSIEHNVTYSNKDTKSEAKHGHLFIDGKELPDVFTSVICGEKAYKFHQRTYLWGMDGYFPVENEKPEEIKISDNKITDEALSRGWYEGKEMLAGTPAFWLRVKWEEGSAFVSPEKLFEMAKTLNLKTIQRNTGLKIMDK